MEELVMVVYRGPAPMHFFPGLLLLFVKDRPQEVTRKVADMLMGNNPEPWQGAYCDRFEIVGETEGGED